LRYVEIGSDEYAFALKLVAGDQVTQSIELHGSGQMLGRMKVWYFTAAH
jgi:hypothetical protein